MRSYDVKWIFLYNQVGEGLLHVLTDYIPLESIIFKTFLTCILNLKM